MIVAQKKPSSRSADQSELDLDQTSMLETERQDAWAHSYIWIAAMAGTAGVATGGILAWIALLPESKYVLTLPRHIWVVITVPLALLFMWIGTVRLSYSRSDHALRIFVFGGAAFISVLVFFIGNCKLLSQCIYFGENIIEHSRILRALDRLF